MRTLKLAEQAFGISVAITILAGCGGGSPVAFAPVTGAASTAAARDASFPAAAKQYTESVLYDFLGGSDGSLSYAGVVYSRGALYGTTLHGGSPSGGYGTVYKFVPSGSAGTESVIYSFAGGADGQYPYAGVIVDKKSHAIYGTTWQGGTPGPGTVFALIPSRSGYTKKTLYSFQGGNDGESPFAGLVEDASGALYGTTVYGGGVSGGYGTVFKLTPGPSGYTETVLHRFQGGSSDGASPDDALLLLNGALYGTTYNGGRYNTGTVFRITGSGSSYTESVLYTFQASPDANHPYSNLVADQSGALYGTTSQGGSTNQGTVFKLTPSGSTYTESILYTFTGCGFSLNGDGCNPQAGLYLTANCSLFGTTLNGGTIGQGTVFMTAPTKKSVQHASGGASRCPGTSKSYTTSVLHSFTGGSDGLNPQSGLIKRGNSFYGTTFYGGSSSDGTIYAIHATNQ